MSQPSPNPQHSAPPVQPESFARWQSAELSLIDDIYTAIASAPDRDAVLTTVAAQLGNLLGATSAYISLYSAATQTITVAAEYLGPDANPDEQASDLGVVYYAPRDFPGVVEALQSGQPLLHYRDDTANPDVIRQHQAQYGGHSSLTLPLTMQGEVLAFLAVWDSRCHREFSPHEIALCQRIARHAAVAIQNAHLYEQARQELAERKQIELALRRSEAHNQALLNAIPDLMFRLDRRGTYLAAKADREQHLIAPVDQLVGRTIHAFLPPNVVDELLRCIAQALRGRPIIR